MTIALTLLVYATAAAIGIRIGHTIGWYRCLRYEPRKSLEFMEQENKMIVENARMVQEHMAMVEKTMRPAQNAIERGMYSTALEKAMLSNHVLRTFIDTCDTIIDKHRYQIRSGPYTTEQARKFLGSVCDALYVRNITINDAVEQILERTYLERPAHTNKVHIQQV